MFIKEGVPTLQTTIHPTSEEILSKMLEQYKVAPALIPFVDHTRLMHNRGTISLEIAITRESAGSLPECTIPLLPQNPNFFMGYDAEIV